MKNERMARQANLADWVGLPCGGSARFFALQEVGKVSLLCLNNK